MPDRVLLTGVSGFLGGHVASALLAAGYQVRGSVRNLAKADKVRDALTKAGADVSRLEFVALDLLKDDGWDAAAEGCRFLLHTASPFVLQMPADKMELIRPATEGTQRALNAGLKAGVERIVLTSSMAAIAYGHDRGRAAPFTAADWTNLEGRGVTGALILIIDGAPVAAGVQGRLVRTPWHDDFPRALVVSAGAAPGRLPPGPAHLGGGTDQVLALLDEQLLHPGQHLRGVVVVQVRNQDPYRKCLTLAQRARVEAGPVIEFRRRLGDPVSCILRNRAHAGSIVQHQRNRGW